MTLSRLSAAPHHTGCPDQTVPSTPSPLTGTYYYLLTCCCTHHSGNRGLLARRNFTITVGPPSNLNETVIKCQQYWNEPYGSAVCKACGFTYLWNGT